MVPQIERPVARPRWPLVSAVLLLYVGLSLAYSVTNPLFEAPDELLHFQFIRYLVDQRALPVQTTTAPTEYHQPPLYYVLNAVVSAVLPDSGYAPQLNGFWRYDGQPPLGDNKNLYLHTALESFPYRDTALNLHVLRGVSILLGVATLLIVFQMATIVFAARPWLSLGAVAVVAFNPQFVFSTSSVNNDVLVTLLGAAMLWWSVRAVQRGLTWRAVLLGGLLCSAALLTKLSAAALIGVVILAVLLAPHHRVARLPALLTIGGITALLSGWWFARNLGLYGELSGLNIMLQAWRSATSSALPPPLAQAWNLWRSYWGEFGYGQIVLPDWIYGLIAAAAVAGAGGLFRLWRWSRRQVIHVDGRVAVILLGAPCLLLLASLVFGAQNPSGLHGRFLLPVSAASGILLIAGWRAWWRPFAENLDRRWSGGVLVVMVGLAVYAWLGVLSPAYAAPQLLTRSAAEQNTTPVNIRLGDEARLLSYHLDPDRVKAGESTTVTLCWEAAQATSRAYYVFVHLLGEANAKIGERRTYTGLGHYPSTRWSAGDIFCDHIPVETASDTASGAYEVEVGLVDAETQTRLPASDAQGNVVSPIILDRLKVRSAHDPIVTEALPQPIDFGGQIKLVGAAVEPRRVRAGDSITLTLHWQALRIPDQDYTVFVQVLDSRGRQVANADSMPQANRYPTSYWDANEIVRDDHRIDLPSTLPPGDYQIISGWYDLATGARLPADGDPSGAVHVGSVEVTAP